MSISINGLRQSRGCVAHNMKVRTYLDGEKKVIVASRPVFIEKGNELQKQHSDIFIPKPKNMQNSTRDDSVRRAKSKVEDIARENSFDFFVTITIDPKRIDSKSPKEVYKAVSVFCSNLVQRYNFKYLLVPELHKNGAIHLHGFFKGNIKLVDSGTVKVVGFEKPMKIQTADRKGIPQEQRQTVYNLPQWPYGFTTAYRITDNMKCINYVLKYITKDVSKIFGNFYLAGGKNLVRDVPYTLGDTDYSKFQGDIEVYCEATDTGYKYLDTARRKERDDVIQGMV